MDSVATTTIAIGKASISGLAVHSFSPIMFILLILVITIGVILWKYGAIIFKQKRTTECPTCMRIVSTINDTYRSRINSTKDDTLRQQMSYAELIFSSIEIKIVSTYKKCLDSLFIPPHKQVEEMNLYKAYLSNETFLLKDMIRLRLKENHILRYTRTQFATYIDEMCEKIVTQTRLDMTNNWCSLFSVPIAMNKHEIDLLIPSIITDIKSIFSNAYDIAEQKDNEVKVLEKQFDDELRKTVNDAKAGRI